MYNVSGHEVESEEHVVIRCPLYADTWDGLYISTAISVPDINQMDDIDKQSSFISSDKIMNASDKAKIETKTFTYM